ncbi:PREDICTED: protein FAM131C isoform X1 [Gavialis gangeticus]|uniref:protein FAM131C isoform X1 n=1 Tax=Gavialis gangeticus TaxID=94835 RepID=UPI00092F9471|nr:PREDICTED: protein FAM131C isoform X1 [Gavialis gangeticus]
MGSCMSKDFLTSAHKEYPAASKPSQPERLPTAPHESQQGPPAAAAKTVSKVTKEPATEDKDHARCLEQPGRHVTCACASLGSPQPATPSRTSPFSPSTTRTPLASSKGNDNWFGSRLWTQKRLGTGAAAYWKRGKPDGFLLGPAAEMFQDLPWDSLQLQVGLRHLQRHSPGDLLSGLVQTIKDHITKPTAMARGRVAHLIEWKGWSAPQSGWEPSLPDEDQYSYLTDELKEARFAAGVAEQFAITEATLSAWSSLDDDEINYGGSSQDVIQLPDLEGIYRQEKILPSPQAISSPQLEGILPAFCPSACTSPPPWGHPTADEWNSSVASLGTLPCGSPHARSSRLGSVQKEPASSAGEQESASSTLQQRLTSSLRYVDSSSLSEDDVFYN